MAHLEGFQVHVYTNADGIVAVPDPHEIATAWGRILGPSDAYRWHDLYRRRRFPGMPLFPLLVHQQAARPIIAATCRPVIPVGLGYQLTMIIARRSTTRL